MIVSHPRHNRPPIPRGWLTIGSQEFAKMALSYIGAMFCSNFAIQFTSYPTQVLVKSCKMVPVMLVNMIRGD